jgi:phosphatidylserine decarboxylase
MYYALFRWVPKSLLTRCAGGLADVRWPGFLLRAFIRGYVRAFGIDMAQFVTPPEGWPTFNAFFTRAVRPAARPVAAERDALLSPVDGCVVAAGRIEAGRLLQAKERDYSLAGLLGGDPAWAAYDGGAFVTLYLHPRDYHRIHAPCAGEVVRFRYVPGELWTVGPRGVNEVPGLFARNERWITFLRTARGEVALVKVGATIVGRIRVVYHPGVGHARGAAPLAETLARPHALAAGAELGRFELGSTVILLTRSGEAELDRLEPGRTVRMGERIGRVLSGG